MTLNSVLHVELYLIWKSDVGAYGALGYSFLCLSQEPEAVEDRLISRCRLPQEC